MTTETTIEITFAVFAVFQCAMLWWLSRYFVTREKYNDDRKAQEESRQLREEAVHQRDIESKEQRNRMENEITEIRQMLSRFFENEAAKHQRE